MKRRKRAMGSRQWAMGKKSEDEEGEKEGEKNTGGTPVPRQLVEHGGL